MIHFRKYVLFLSVCLLSCGFTASSFSRCDDVGSESGDNFYLKEGVCEKVKGRQADLWSPVEEVEDGAVYMVRSAVNTNLYWDITNGDLSDGTAIQLYDYNCTASQKFYFKKQFRNCGSDSFRLSPLYAYDKLLRFQGSGNQRKLMVDSERYSQNRDDYLFSDKLHFSPCADDPTRFVAYYIPDGKARQYYLTVNSLNTGSSLVAKEGGEPAVWEIVKTDYLGLNVGNRVRLSGVNTFRYVVRVPFPGEYVIETKKYKSVSYNTNLTLIRDSDGKKVAFDEDSGDEKNARIEYVFPDVGEYSVLISGYDGYDMGSCFLILRPAKTVYLSGIYDIRGSENHLDGASALLRSREAIRKLGLFPEVYVNRPADDFFEDDDWEEEHKANRDFFVFYGHGATNGNYVRFYSGDLIEHFYTLPDMRKAGVVLWASCYSGVDDVSTSNIGMAPRSIDAGAKYSIGFPGKIYSVTADTFITSFFTYLEGYTIEAAVKMAAEYAASSNLAFVAFSLIKNLGDTVSQAKLFKNDGAGVRSTDKERMCGFTTTHSTKAPFLISNGVYVAKSLSSIDVLAEKDAASNAIERLKKDWMSVELFLGNDGGVAKAIAVCVDEANGVIRYVDTKTMDTIEPRVFESFMCGGSEI